MTCREFTKKIEALPLSELTSAAPADVLAHQSNCPSCTALLQERSALAGALQVLRSRTAAVETPAVVEQNVLRAFRQSSVAKPASALRAMPQPTGFRLSNLFGWKMYAAAAAVLAIGLGLGLWIVQHSGQQAVQQQTAHTEQPTEPRVVQTEEAPQLKASVSNSVELSSAKKGAVAPQIESVSTSSVARNEQAQGYTPLMLCDPISCSGEEQVVRMELPANPADSSAGSQMADVIVGDDGLVRAIRIVQQQ